MINSCGGKKWCAVENEKEKGQIRQEIKDGRAILGIELGSTRIKAVLIRENHVPIAYGGHEWENQLADGIWTYALGDVWAGLQDAYRDMAEQVRAQYGERITALGGIGISAMMHGYMAFDRSGELLTPFRTWRNTVTEEASLALTELFQYPVPQRWSVSHLYQAILNREDHVRNIDYLITLGGYVHWKLTGQRAVGIGDASGMFPVDTGSGKFDEHRMAQFDELVESDKLPWKLRDILPRVLAAGEQAGTLTEAGARLLDVSGSLKSGVALCPPEGDAGTGMTATNSVSARTGNISEGTSIFAMVVLEKKLKKPHPEIDLVTTPSGDPVGMVHCNNCTSELDAWTGIFEEFARSTGIRMDRDRLYHALYHKALEGDADCGGLFKTKDASQSIVAAAVNTPVSVMESAGEGGAWGIALLAAYMIHRESGETLASIWKIRCLLVKREVWSARIPRMWRGLTCL